MVVGVPIRKSLFQQCLAVSLLININRQWDMHQLLLFRKIVLYILHITKICLWNIVKWRIILTMMYNIVQNSGYKWQKKEFVIWNYSRQFFVGKSIWLTSPRKRAPYSLWKLRCVRHFVFEPRLAMMHCREHCWLDQIIVLALDRVLLLGNPSAFVYNSLQ